MPIKTVTAEARSFPFPANPEIVPTPADKSGRQMVFFSRRRFSLDPQDADRCLNRPKIVFTRLSVYLEALSSPLPHRQHS